MEMCYKLILLLVVIAVVLYCYPMMTGKEGFGPYYSQNFMYPTYDYPSYWYPGRYWGNYPPGYYFGRPRYWHGPGRRNWRWRWW